jgi:sporulation protein YlmC with PRC-barrel domain
MRLATLALAGSIFATSGIAAAIEMVKPFEALEQSRRAMIELDRRQTREGAELRRREKEDQAKRNREEVEQRKREKAEAVQKQAERKSVSSPATAPKERSAGSSTPTQPSAPSTLTYEPRAQAERKSVSSPATAPKERSAGSSTPTQPSAASTLTYEPRAQAATAPPDTQATERDPLASPARPHASSLTAPHLTGPVTGQPDEREARSGASQSHVGAPLGQRDPQSASGSPAGAGAKPNDVAAPAKSATGQAIPVSRLKSMHLYNERGDKLGDVEQVVQSSDGNFHIVIGAGGFLGLRERDVRIPLARVTLRRNGLVIHGLTDDQVKVMPVFDRSDRTYRDLGRNTTVPVLRDPSEK